MEDIYLQALKYCIETGQASVSHIQRRFPIGYIQSCKIIERMESEGFISCEKNSDAQQTNITQEELDKLNQIALDIKLQSNRNTVNRSSEFNQVLDAAEAAAKDYGSSYIGSEHLIYAMLDNECIAGKILRACDVNAVKYAEYFVRSIDTRANIKGYTPRTKYMIEQASTFANDIEGGEIQAGTEHLLLAIVSSSECLAMRILKAIDVNLNNLAIMLEMVLKNND